MPLPPTDNSFSFFEWIHDWASWLIAGLTTIVSVITIALRRSEDEGSRKRVEKEHQAAIIELSKRVAELEKARHADAVKIGEFSATLLAINGSISRIDTAMGRIEERIDKALLQTGGSSD